MSACDLCGASEATLLPQPPGSRALRSDRHVVEGRLTKIECARCGLVRDGAPTAATPRYYRDEYRVNDSDHVFYSKQGSRHRSAVFADWIEEALTVAAVAAPQRVLEIGAGRGYLTRAGRRRHAKASSSESMRREMPRRRARTFDRVIRRRCRRANMTW
jgi:hypothetical protein